MIKYLLRHQWLQFRRSASFERELSINIFIWFIGVFCLLGIIAMAIALPKALGDIEGVDDPVIFLNKALVYYFFVELIMRYFLQKVPVLDIEPYLNLPISRKHITNFLIGKSLLSVFNVIALILVLPFGVQVLLPEYGTTAVVIWVAGIFFLSLCLHFFNILFKKKLEDLPVVWAIIILLATGNYLLSNYQGMDLFSPLSMGLAGMLTLPIGIAIPLITLLILVFLTLKFYKENLYLEELESKGTDNAETYSERLSFLGSSSLSNTLILQEIRMILRHKRTRSVLLLSLIFVGYGLIFFGKDNYSGGKGFYVFLGVFMSGMFTINYGQFFWSWNTNQLDFFLTKPIAIHSWLKSRYRLLVVGCIITVILCTPYLYFGWDVLFLILAGGFYNIGINIPLMMRLAMWGPKAIDLNKSAFMNYQGAGAAQWLMSLPLLIGPYLIYVPVSIFFGYMWGVAAIALAGIIGFTFNDYFILLIARKFSKVKYKLIHDLTI